MKTQYTSKRASKSPSRRKGYYLHMAGTHSARTRGCRATTPPRRPATKRQVAGSSVHQARHRVVDRPVAGPGCSSSGSGSSTRSLQTQQTQDPGIEFPFGNVVERRRFPTSALSAGLLLVPLLLLR